MLNRAALNGSRVVFPVPFKKKAKAVLPSSEAVGVVGLLPKVNSKLPAASPAINTATIPSINTPSRRGWTAHLPVQEFAVAAISTLSSTQPLAG